MYLFRIGNWKEKCPSRDKQFLPTSLPLCVPSSMAWNHPPPRYTHPDPQNVVIAEVRSSQNIISSGKVTLNWASVSKPMDEEFVRWGKDTKRCWGKVIGRQVETGIQSRNKNFAATRSWKRQRDSLWMSLELSTAGHIALLKSSSFQTSSLWPHKNKLPKCFKQFNVYLWQQDQEVRTPSKIF